MIRAFRIADAEALAALQRRSISKFGRSCYNGEQVSAWLGRAKNADFFRVAHGNGAKIFVGCKRGGQITGYALLEADGHLDHLYADPGFGGEGFATDLIAACVIEGKDNKLPRLYSEVSEIARPVFEKSGWQVDHRRDFEIEGVPIHNYAMSLNLT